MTALDHGPRRSAVRRIVHEMTSQCMGWRRLRKVGGMRALFKRRALQAASGGDGWKIDKYVGAADRPIAVSTPATSNEARTQTPQIHNTMDVYIVTFCYNNHGTCAIVSPVLTFDHLDYPPARELWQQNRYPCFHVIALQLFHVS